MRLFFTQIMQRFKTRIAFIILSVILLGYQEANAQAPLVSLQEGKLVYNKYANRGELNVVNQIPDFSNAGYKGGGVVLPDLPVKETVQAIPGDCGLLIQAAIDKVSALPADANGHRGAVLLKAGIYRIEGQIFIRTGGVVLRGEGNGLNGTILIAMQKTQHDFIIVQGGGSGYGEVAGTRVKITTDFVPTGSKTLEVAAGHSFHPGDKIVVQKTPTESWIDVLNMRQYGWTASQYKNTYEREVTSVNGNTIGIDIPMMDPFEQLYGSGEVFKSNITGRIQESGIENMRLESFFVDNNDENHAWNAIEMNRSENCWVRDVVAKYFGYACVSVSNMSRFNTVQDCAMIDPKSQTTGGRKYSFNLEGNANSILFQRCFTWGGRHDFVSGSRVPGPNVFLDCAADNTFADIGPHHRYGTGQIYDNVYGGQIRVQNRGASGSGHGWSGAQILFWNCNSYKSDIEVESPPTARNWGIGCIGKQQTNTGYWESWGTHVLPRSLYLQQLQERLGPQAIENIVTPDQLTGVIWTRLLDRGKKIAAEAQVPTSTVSAKITSPLAGAMYDAPASITINATATDTVNTVVKVEFFNGTTKLGEDLTSPYSFLWINVGIGTYSLQVRATNSAGHSSSSATILVTVKPPPGPSFDITDNGGIISAQYPNTSKPSENFPSLIDNSKTTKYFRSGRTALWIQYQSTAPAIVVKYTLTSANDVPNRDPRDWNLQGSNNGTSWTTIDTRTGQTFSSRFLTKTYTCSSNTIPYLYYRLNITNNNGDTGTQLAEWELYERRLQTISFEEIEKTYGDEPFELNASASSGLPLTFEIVSGPATVEGNILTILGAGTVTVRARQDGNEFYFPVEVTKTFTVNKAQQTITFEAIDTKTYGDEPFELIADVDTELPLTFELVSGPASISGSLLTILGAGDVTVRVSQAGNENYLPAAAEQTFTINKATQSITFEEILPANQSDIIELSASASSGLPVSFEIVDGPGALAGNSLAFTDQGEVVVRAIQEGNENYLPAQSVEQVILVYADDAKKDGLLLIANPNPTKGKVMVKLDNKKDKEYAFAVYDKNGQVVDSSIIPKSHKMFEIDLQREEDGIYYLWVSDGAEIWVRRIIKE